MNEKMIVKEYDVEGYVNNAEKISNIHCGNCGGRDFKINLQPFDMSSFISVSQGNP